MPAGIRRTGLVAATAAARSSRPLLASRTREDPFFSRVTLLCPFNGDNNGTSFPDLSASSLTLTRDGTNAPTTKTDQSVFAGSSGYFDGTGYLTLPSDSDNFTLLGESFTVEVWVRLANVSGVKVIAGLWSSPSASSWRFLVSDNRVGFGWVTAAGVAGSVEAGALSANTWHHLAATRAGSTVSVYANGSRTAFGTLSAKIRTVANALNIGRNEESNVWYMNGHMAELRITKGVARYTGSTYPLPAFPHPVR